MAEKAAGAAGDGGGDGGSGDGGGEGKTLVTSGGNSGDSSGDAKGGDGDGSGGDGKGGGKTLVTGGDGKSGDDGDGKGGDGAKQGAPESYADFTLPEGMEKLGDDDSKEFHGLLKGLDLTQEKAQKLVDFQAKIAKGQGEAALAEFKKTTDGWRDATIKELGSDYKKELGFTSKAIERLGSPELRQLLDDTMVGNHPEMAKFLIKVGKLVAEDKMDDGNKGGDGNRQQKSDGELFYPGMNEEVRKARATS